jgi:hypothetical protein
MAFGLRFKTTLLYLLVSLRGGASGIDRPFLYSVYGNDIQVRLRRIHGHPQRDGPDGTLTVALYGRAPAFVQCRFADGGARLVCEIVPGRYPPKPGRPAPVLSAGMAEKLHQAGYRRDDGGRLVFSYDITPDSGVWGGAAVVILDPLIAVFGARALSRIDIVAPLAPERDEAAIRHHMRGP